MPTTLPTYDVFVSYAHADQDWVWEWLVPRLKAAGLAVCTDLESFDVGVPIVENIENAVAASRHTLLVLTEAWVGGRWTRFESLLKQTKDPSGLLQGLLPVLRRPCAPPRRIGMLTYADLTGQRDTEAEFAKLLDAIHGVRRLPDAGTTATTLGLQEDLARAGLADAATEIEVRYRTDLAHDLRWHDFRGIYQFKQKVRLPLADIYQELGLLQVSGEREHRLAREQLVAMDEEERLAALERRLQERVTAALARSQRLVILGDPGAGKSISLRFITLMLADRQGAARLGLAAPYLPIMVRAAYFAQALQKTPALSLDAYLQQYILQAFTSHPRLGEFVRLALERGVCMVLLDGLDEVGNDAVDGQNLRQKVVKGVQQFADRWCTADRPNRLIVTSRIEGYWDDPLNGCDHVELSPLSPPDEVGAFLRRWYEAYERTCDPNLPPATAIQRAEKRTAELLPQLMDAKGVRRLAANPLLLTILILIYENVGKLPNRRAKLYETCTKTLIDTWREEQTDRHSNLLDDPGEAVVTGVIASLSYWLHERRPGGTASLSECRARLLAILSDEVGYEPSQAREIANKILSYASSEAGLLCERGLAQYGFFHLTLEEYLAAYHLTRQPPARRHDMLQAHWEDDRWREVILLAAGQLGVVEPKPYDVSAFLQDLLQMEPTDAANVGREAVLAGRALADIGTRAVNPKTQRWVIDALRQTMQDLDAKTNRPNEPPHISVRTRYAAGETWDELGELPEDLDAWILCPQCADPSPRSELVLNAVKEQASGGDPSASSGQALLATKYPITNTQFARFIEAGGYENFDYWGGKGSEGWQWRVKGKRRYSSVGTDQPEYWNDPRFGKDRRGYPVVGVSWYEAAAYAVWLTETLQATGHRLQIWRHGQLETCDLRPATLVVRLPTEAEWLRLAGGEKEGKRERYPWDAPGSGRVTDDEKDKNAILARANTSESGIGGTSPVAMYPLGESKPFGLWDVAGNVWEWTDSWYDEEQRDRVLRGGSWYYHQRLARPSVRNRVDPDYSHRDFGFRLVSPISSGS